MTEQKHSHLDEPKTLLRLKGPDDLGGGPCDWGLVVYAGAQLGTILPVVPGDNVLGRASGVQIVLNDERVSRAHAKIVLAGDGSSHGLAMEDLGSTNGTYLNGRRIEGRVKLLHGDRVAMGDHILKVVAFDALERRFHESLLAQGTMDALTGLSNRAATLAALHSHFERSRRYGHPLSVVMCDLDHFKRINDTHGHAAGDAVLTRFGALLKETLRASDFAGRIGGEEFLIILTETGSEGACLLAERVRAVLSLTPFSFETGAQTVTCSQGIASLEADDKDPGAMLARADGLLYRAKHQGRNQVVAA